MNIEQEALDKMRRWGTHTAVCRALEARDEVQAAFDAYRREVSETVQRHIDKTDDDCSALWRAVTRCNLQHLIIPEPVDPLDITLDELGVDRADFDAALAKIGGKVVFEGEGA